MGHRPEISATGGVATGRPENDERGRAARIQHRLGGSATRDAAAHPEPGDDAVGVRDREIEHLPRIAQVFCRLGSCVHEGQLHAGRGGEPCPGGDRGLPVAGHADNDSAARARDGIGDDGHRARRRRGDHHTAGAENPTLNESGLVGSHDDEVVGFGCRRQLPRGAPVAQFFGDGDARFGRLGPPRGLGQHVCSLDRLRPGIGAADLAPFVVDDVDESHRQGPLTRDGERPRERIA